MDIGSTCLICEAKCRKALGRLGKAPSVDIPGTWFRVCPDFLKGSSSVIITGLKKLLKTVGLFLYNIIYKTVIYLL